MPVEIQIPYDFVQQVMHEIQPRIDAAMEVAKDVGGIIRDRAILDNEDVNGNQFPKKQPRPPRNPRNFPDIALIQDDELDEMNPDRWTVDQSGLMEITVTYHPSDHHDYLVEKAPQNGGRKWLTQTEMNQSAKEEIERRMAEALEK